MACPRCAKDPARRANYRCLTCSAPVCESCTFNTRFCSEKCNRRYQSFFGRFGAGLRRRTGLPEIPGGSSGGWIVVLLFVLALLGGVVFAHSRGLVKLPAPVGPLVDRFLPPR